MEFFLPHLRCPITKTPLQWVDKAQFSQHGIPEHYGAFTHLDGGLKDDTGQYFHPVFNGIIVLHEQYALFIGEGQDGRSHLSFDKQRVFDYYNEVNYKTQDALQLYEDSPKWVDYREVSAAYMRASFIKAARFYAPTGQYLLDVASGPIGLPEYMGLCDGYAHRVCVDISINALLQAKANMARAGKSGVFICGDITNIPIQDGVVDTVLSQHTLYHIPKNDQKTAVEEMYRVAKAGAKIVIVYSWFYHSAFMNLSLHLIQLYRVARHFAGKLYVRAFPSKPRLYFYPHSPRWFKTTFPFSSDIEFFCWRSTNKYFMDLYIHKWLGGRHILAALARWEDRHSRFMALFGEYPAIVITKRKKTESRG